ncbi:MAG: HdeD family acid-resistance protein [Hyphomicrobiaceae bacterium]
MTEQAISSSSVEAMRAQVAQYRTWFIIMGICLILLGAAAIAFPFVTTIAAKIFLGWLFLVGGVIQVVHAFSTQRWGAFFLNLLVGLLYVIAGGWLAFFPLTGLLTLTILLAAMFVAQGILEIAIAMQMRGHGSWGWILLAGIVAIAAGVMIFMSLPSSAIWAIGLLVGINMISSGWAYLFIALAAGQDSAKA